MPKQDPYEGIRSGNNPGVYDIVVKFRDRPVGPINFVQTLNFQVTVS